MATELRPYQTEAIEALRASLRGGHRRPVLMAPTGAGKTRIASEIVNMVRGKGKRVAFCVPAISLIDQTVEMFHAEGVRYVGVIQADHRMTDWDMPVQICSIQTLQNRSHFPAVDGVLIDECHRLSRLVSRWMFTPGWEKVPFIGLSATPWTKGMAKLYDDLIIAATTEELIAAGYLSPFRVFAPGHPDLSAVKIVAGDYHEGQLGETMNKAALVADVVETWKRLSGHTSTFVFAVDRAHAKALERRFTEAGVPTEYMDCFTPLSERNDIKDRFHRGATKVVANVGVLTTGVDWDVRCIVLARPTRSEILHVQILGRGLRTGEGKEYLTVLDHADNHKRLGFITDIYHDSLNDTKMASESTAARKKLPKECPRCTFLRPVGVATCPNCGFKPQPVSNVETRAGELVEREPTPKAHLKSVNGHVYLGEEQMEKAAFYAQLQWIGAERGYRPGWAANKFRYATGVWPNHYRNAQPVEATLAVRNWIKHLDIAWARSSHNPANK